MGRKFDPAIAAIEVIGILEVLVSVLVDADEGAGLQIIISVYLPNNNNSNFCNLYKTLAVWAFRSPVKLQVGLLKAPSLAYRLEQPAQAIDTQEFRHSGNWHIENLIIILSV